MNEETDTPQSAQVPNKNHDPPLGDLKQFVSTHIPSVDHLRMLLHLRSNPSRAWEPLGLAARLYMRPQSAESAAADLTAHGLATRSGDPPHYRYEPSSEEMAAMVEQLVEMDRVQPVTLINMIYAKPRDLQAFADAFKLTKEKKES